MERIVISTANNVAFSTKPFINVEDIYELLNTYLENSKYTTIDNNEVIFKTLSNLELIGGNGEVTRGIVSEWIKKFIAIFGIDDDPAKIAENIRLINSYDANSLLILWLCAAIDEKLRNLLIWNFYLIHNQIFDFKTILYEDLVRIFALDQPSKGEDLSEQETFYESPELLAASIPTMLKHTKTSVDHMIDDIVHDLGNYPREVKQEDGTITFTVRDNEIIFKRWLEIVYQNLFEKGVNTVLSFVDEFNALIRLSPNGFSFHRFLIYQFTAFRKRIVAEYFVKQGEIETSIEIAEEYVQRIIFFLFQKLKRDQLITPISRTISKYEKNALSKYMNGTSEGSVLKPGSKIAQFRYKLQQFREDWEREGSSPGGIQSYMQFQSEESFKDDHPSSLSEFGLTKKKLNIIQEEKKDVEQSFSEELTSVESVVEKLEAPSVIDSETKARKEETQPPEEKETSKEEVSKEKKPRKKRGG